MFIIIGDGLNGLLRDNKKYVFNS